MAKRHLHHYGDDGRDLCHSLGHHTHYSSSELRYHGMRPARRVCMAHRRDSDFTLAPRGQRPDKERLPHLFSH